MKHQAQAFYLLVFPHAETAVPPTPQQPIQGLKEDETVKDAPYFQPVDIEVQTIAQETVQIEGVSVQIHRQVYDNLVQIVECSYSLTEPLRGTAVSHKNQIETHLRQQLLPPEYQTNNLYEEYAVLILPDIEGTPDEFISQNARSLARFMRSERTTFSPDELQDVLLSRVRYSDQELTLVDWDGAIVFAPQNDYQSEIELMKIGNYQLLSYRLLDQAIEQSLERISDNFSEGTRPSLLPNPSRHALREVIEQRLSLMLNFERTDQNLLLIGDWYTAKLYRTIQDEFYLDEWKTIIKKKLDNLESIVQIIQDNFSVSWERFFNFVELAGWLLLLAGYFVLFYLDVVSR